MVQAFDAQLLGGFRAFAGALREHAGRRSGESLFVVAFRWPPLDPTWVVRWNSLRPQLGFQLWLIAGSPCRHHPKQGGGAGEATVDELLRRHTSRRGDRVDYS